MNAKKFPAIFPFARVVNQKPGLVRLGLLFALVLGFLTIAPVSAQKGNIHLSNQMLNHLSQSVSIRYWLAHPEAAPAPLGSRTRQLQAARTRGTRAPDDESTLFNDRFNKDKYGLPQNEESLAVCSTKPKFVLGGTNDYAGFILDPQGNGTGWYFSNDGGSSVKNWGWLPGVSVGGEDTPSGGDPVSAVDNKCNFFAASLNYNSDLTVSGIGVYKARRKTLINCPGGGSDPSCWPTRRSVADAPPSHFYDKEWMAVGDTGDGQHVWVTWTDFLTTGPGPLDFTASILAARCDANLVTCTAPILISGSDPDVQFSDVTIGADGRTYITWAEIQGELEGTAQTFIIKLRIIPAGSTTPGPTQYVYTETLPLPFGGLLSANDFRIATVPKSDVVMIGPPASQNPRIFVVWDACQTRPLDTICEQPLIKLSFSDNDGSSWSSPMTLSIGGSNYFPTLSGDENGKLAVAWYTSRQDEVFGNRQNVELVTVNAATLAVTNRQIVKDPENETEADPLLGGFFIGDYIEVVARDGTAYVHFNANYRKRILFGTDGLPVPQQDNYLVKKPM